jgi:hypothetical protein
MKKLIPNSHPGEDAFENYAFNRLSAKETAVFEEHLLICEKCQERLAEADTYICLMKAAAAAYVVQHSRDQAKDRNPSSTLRIRDHPIRKNAGATAVLLVTCLTAILSWKTTARTPDDAPKAVELNAYRGGVSQAPAKLPLDLNLDLRDLPPADGYRVEVVDATGQRVWSGGIPARLLKGLPSGIYWVRLLTDSGNWLREYGLKIE